MTKYEYHINLDERGEFNADVRNPNGEHSIYTINTYDGYQLIEDGFISDIRDPASIEAYLKDLGLLDANDLIISPYNEVKK